MKKRNFSRIIVLVLSLALLVGAVFTIAASAEENDSTGKFGNISLAYKDKVAIRVQVDATEEEIINGDVVVSYELDGKTANATYHETLDGKVWVITEGIAYYDLGQIVTFSSYVNGVQVESGRTYSAAQFFYKMLYTDSGITEEYRNLYVKSLEVGALQQIAFDINTDKLVTDSTMVKAGQNISINGKSTAFAPAASLEVTPQWNGELTAGASVIGWVISDENGQSEVGLTFTCSGVVEILEPIIEVSIVPTIPAFENGAVTADKASYKVGDTVTLTVSPAKDYAQKLYINGEELLVNTNSQYSFVVEEGKTYEISGEFVYVKGNWYWTNNGEFGLLNQAHGIINAPAHPGKDATGELVPTLDMYYGGRVLVTDPFKGTKQDYAIVLKMAFSDGQKAEIRLVNKDGNGHYMVQSMSGIFGSWKWYYDLNDAENAAVANGEGVWFGLVREGTDIKISVNGSVKTRGDVTVNVPENVVLNQFKVQAYNYDKAVDIKYEFYKIGNKSPVTIDTFENGTVTADKASYKVGDTVTLTVSPAKDYAQKLYINGEALLVDTNSQYSFVVEEGKTYDITGEFVYVKGDWYWTAEYIVLNQAHGVFHSPKPAGGEKNGELVPTYDKCYGGKVLVTDPYNGTKQDYAIVLKMQFSDGQKAEVRLVNKDGNGHYMVQSMSGIFGTWKWYYDLNDAENAAVANGEGVWFGLVREGTDIKISVNGSVKTRGDVTVNVPVDVVLNQFKVTTFNFDKAVDIKYEFYMYE